MCLRQVSSIRSLASYTDFHLTLTLFQFTLSSKTLYHQFVYAADSNNVPVDRLDFELQPRVPTIHSVDICLYPILLPILALAKIYDFTYFVLIFHYALHLRSYNLIYSYINSPSLNSTPTPNLQRHLTTPSCFRIPLPPCRGPSTTLSFFLNRGKCIFS